MILKIITGLSICRMNCFCSWLNNWKIIIPETYKHNVILGNYQKDILDHNAFVTYLLRNASFIATIMWSRYNMHNGSNKAKKWSLYTTDESNTQLDGLHFSTPLQCHENNYDTMKIKSKRWLSKFYKTNNYLSLQTIWHINDHDMWRWKSRSYLGHAQMYSILL